MDKSIGIYIHIPFCKSKCYYCDFSSYSGKDSLAGPYFDSLFSEIEGKAEELGERTVRSVFIGGGTPSYVNPEYIIRTMEICSKYFRLDSNAEVSIESNPGTLTYEKLKAYKEAGINRLSIGLQAWQDHLLSELGRIHSKEQYVENIEAAYKAGFRNINTDLIFGLPNQSLEDWAETLEMVTSVGKDLGLVHLSCYSLQIEEGTVFGDRLQRGTLKPADDKLDRKMYSYAIKALKEKGFHHYEISNFAKPGYECRHNMIYWKALEYAGFGAGAHSYLNGFRSSNPEKIEEYIEAVNGGKLSGWGESQYIDKRESMSEFMILGLRLVDGVSSREFEERFSQSLQSVFGETIEHLYGEGLLEMMPEKNGKDGSADEIIKLTRLGLDLGNKVFAEFLNMS